MNGTQFFIEQQARRAIGAVESAERSLSQARNLLELVRATSHASVDPLVRTHPSVRSAKTRLAHRASERAETLTRELLKAFDENLDSEVLLRQVHEAYRCCCGAFPLQAQHLHRALATRSFKQEKRASETALPSQLSP
jgi:hypothetical protein